MNVFLLIILMFVSSITFGYNSASVLIVDSNNNILAEKNSNQITPIASITKLMTAIIVLDANQNLNETITISKKDVDKIKHTHSRLKIGTVLTRHELLLLALMSSENRAASALLRTYPKGVSNAVKSMNKTAKQLGMFNTKFVDGTGLSYKNKSTAHDLIVLAKHAVTYDTIRHMSTNKYYIVDVGKQQQLFKSTNWFIRNDKDISFLLSKTGYTKEAGKCVLLVIEDPITKQPIYVSLLKAKTSEDRWKDVGNLIQEQR